VTGTWKSEFDSQIGHQKYTFTFQQDGSKLTGTFPTVTASLKHLEKLGIVRETTGSKYGRLYAYDRYLKILNAET